jgi:MerR family copper efflux transcriptional regulator
MPSEPPIACSLTASELAQRIADMSAIGRASLLTAEADQTRAVLTFRPSAFEQLAAVVAAEAECCPFLKMKLEDGPDAVQLTIEAPAGADSVLDDLVAAFASTQAA